MKFKFFCNDTFCEININQGDCIRTNRIIPTQYYGGPIKEIPIGSYGIVDSIRESEHNNSKDIIARIVWNKKVTKNIIEDPLNTQRMWTDLSITMLNPFSKVALLNIVSHKKEKGIKNNEGREICFSCGSPTKQIEGFIKNYTICTVCGK